MDSEGHWLTLWRTDLPVEVHWGNSIVGYGLIPTRLRTELILSSEKTSDTQLKGEGIFQQRIVQDKKIFSQNTLSQMSLSAPLELFMVLIPEPHSTHWPSLDVLATEMFLSFIYSLTQEKMYSCRNCFCPWYTAINKKSKGQFFIKHMFSYKNFFSLVCQSWLSLDRSQLI